MSRLGRRFASAHGGGKHSEAGFTAVELLVVMAIMGLVMGLVTQSVVTTMQSQRRQLERLEALNEVKTAFHRVTRDVRGANPLATLEADLIGMTVERGGEERDIVFRLDGTTLLMDETSPTGTFTHTLATDLDPGTVLFSYLDPDGNQLAPPAAPSDVLAVEIRLRRALPEENDIEFRDRITIRNTQG